MDGQLPEHYKPYNIDWEKLGYLDWPKRPQPDLQFPINPILKKIHHGRRMFYGLDEAYTLIEPAIRLASAYLASPQSMLFIYSMVYETQRMTDQINPSTGKPHSRFRITAEGDPKVLLRRIHRVFQETALFNTWGPKPEWDGPRVAGCTIGYDEIDRDGSVCGVRISLASSSYVTPELQKNARFSPITIPLSYNSVLLSYPMPWQAECKMS